jgi:hypothetical protein
MVKHGKTMCKIVHHVTFLMWMEKLTYFLLLSLLAFDVCCANNFQRQQLCWCVIGVQKVDIWDV